jgi:hypothetical protein
MLARVLRLVTGVLVAMGLAAAGACAQARRV